MEHGIQRVSEIVSNVEGRLLDFSDFLCGRKSFKSGAMAAYLEEFPGLVHFVHVDRSSGRIIAPAVTKESSLIPIDKVSFAYVCY